ncbi:hypothetical protein SANA_20020 [Gottschalkiaceae bacterium SANA]|nr:hypothetical protein SANA_20020 [Gottschalkiaceae bacterium SANA]
MINKIGKTLRKAHRYLTPVFIVVTILYMFVFKVPLLARIQKVLMLTMAVSGAFLFFQIYYNKNKAKKRKAQK